MIHALVTGGAGFIGSHLAERLVKTGRRVTILDDFSNGLVSNLNEVIDDIKIVEYDVSKPFIELIDLPVNEIYHLACYPRQISFQDVRRDCEVNLHSTLNCIDLSRKYDAKILFTSNTGIVSKPSRLPVDETFPPNPLSPYDVHKLASEHLLHVHSLYYGLRSIIVRFASVYGPRQYVNRYLGWHPVVPEFIMKLRTSKAPTIDGDGSQTRDFLYVEDAVDGVVRAMESDSDSGDMFILGTGRQTSILELYNMIADLLASDVEPMFGPPKKDDIQAMQYDSSKAKRVFDWEPKVTAQEGLLRTISQ